MSSETSPAIDALAWQESWDRQQEAYLPDREERISAMLDVVAAVTNGAPRVLDLAGGTGSISLRVLRRFTTAQVTLLDMDPLLMGIARATFGNRIEYVSLDLRSPNALAAHFADKRFDAVLTATALHYLPAERLSAVYAEVAHLIEPGGVFINAESMPDDGLPDLNQRLLDYRRRWRESRYATGAALSWPQWWELAAQDPALAKLLEERRALLGEKNLSSETVKPVSPHIAALREAGFREVGVVWRGLTDAAVAGVR